MADCERHEREIVMLRELVAKRETTFVELQTALQHLHDLIPENLGAALASVSTKLDNAVRDIAELKGLIRSDFVNRHEFDPVKKIVYGMVGLILTAVIVALIALVVKQ